MPESSSVLVAVVDWTTDALVLEIFLFGAVDAINSNKTVMPIMFKNIYNVPVFDLITCMLAT